MIKKRCAWVNVENDLCVKYHDEEWGIPTHDDRLLFEMLILEGAQAGLSWKTVLKKRDNYKEAFDHFDPIKVSQYGEDKILELLQNKGIIRNKLKIISAIQNAKVFLEIQKKYGSFDKYIWAFVNNNAILNNWTSVSEIPTKTKLSDIISKSLKKQGMNFVGSTIVYAFLQAIGIINDHTVNCFRYKEICDLSLMVS